MAADRAGQGHVSVMQYTRRCGTLMPLVNGLTDWDLHLVQVSVHARRVARIGDACDLKRKAVQVVTGSVR